MFFFKVHNVNDVYDKSLKTLKQNQQTLNYKFYIRYLFEHILEKLTLLEKLS